jgi:hypothetical protein
LRLRDAAERNAPLVFCTLFSSPITERKPWNG